MERLSASTVLFSCSNSRSTDVIELSRNALLDNALSASRVLSSGTGPGEQAGYAIFIFLGIGPGGRGTGTTSAGGPSFCRISVIGSGQAAPGTALLNYFGFLIISLFKRTLMTSRRGHRQSFRLAEYSDRAGE
jgi:hypothetical protein